jgi:cytochrome c oxidase assembly factor CtaG
MHPHVTIFALAGAPLAPGELWRGWTPEPAVLLALAVLATAYHRGLRRLWRSGPRAVSGRQAVAFAAGLAAVAVALVSPLDTLAGALFAAHMAQHMLLIMIAAPLLVLGAPGLPLLLALPPAWRRRLVRIGRHPLATAGWHLLSRPVVAWAVHVGALWLWHLPGPYQTALASDLVHAAEHASFLGTAMLFWWVVLAADRRRRLAPGFVALYLFAAALQGSALGALLVLAPAPLYPLQALGSASLGIPALADQQVAGLIMWIPADLVYLGSAAALFMRWLLSLEGAAPRHDENLRPPVPVRHTPRPVHQQGMTMVANMAVADRADEEGV